MSKNIAYTISSAARAKSFSSAPAPHKVIAWKPQNTLLSVIRLGNKNRLLRSLTRTSSPLCTRMAA
jgi:hypothetical protein